MSELPILETDMNAPVVRKRPASEVSERDHGQRRSTSLTKGYTFSTRVGHLFLYPLSVSLHSVCSVRCAMLVSARRDIQTKQA